MFGIVCHVVRAFLAAIIDARSLALENLALRHQLGVLERRARHRPGLTRLDRILWVWLSHAWSGWKDVLRIARPETVANVTWGAPRVHGELLKLGIDVSPATVAKYMVRRECLDHVIVLNERYLRRDLREYLDAYYHPVRPHLSLGKDSPVPRPVQPPRMGKVVSFPILGGLHHRY